MFDLPFGSITDVPGVTVGHHQRTSRGWQTGTTAIIVESGATPGVDVRGGGPGTRETDALHPQNLIQKIHGICLTGGSAYGLAAAHGVMEWLEGRGLGFPIGQMNGSPQVVPVVPAAVIFDLGRGGSPANRPDATFGVKAADTARRSQQRWGSVGAGTGARAGGLQGGVGTASTTVRLPESDIEVTVGALAVANPNGSVIDPTIGLPWEPSGARLRRPPANERRALIAALTDHASLNLNTTIGVVATSARLDKAETSKMASVAHDGLARAVRPAHSMTDGDTIFGLAVGDIELSAVGRHVALNVILQAASDTFAAACTHAVLAASTIGLARAYSDICPSVYRSSR
ncbi:MAG: P1 family peptidase [Actinomycetota bacterium]|jgi:L-aminopeptidase/D-esterase-like protein|uniref:P1 family peptidase n=1 Tax=uncultured Ilumatobacter sp. TaxID=879968 RepID=UPI00374F015A|nr:P1 family peptidase [Actinomycetota bacterium]